MNLYKKEIIKEINRTSMPLNEAEIDMAAKFFKELEEDPENIKDYKSVGIAINMMRQDLMPSMDESPSNDRSASEIFAEMTALVTEFMDNTDSLVKKDKPRCQH